MAKKKRGYLEISFSTFFSILVGAVILSLTIYGVSKLIGIGQTTQDAKVGKEIGILLNPLETSFSSDLATSFTLPVETRIYNQCKNNGVFGKQMIKISQISFGEWTDTDMNIDFENKYIFSREVLEGKNFYVFSKPFDFPYKVADLIYMGSADEVYCFINPPKSVNSSISVNPDNFVVNNCPDESTRVCFSGGSNCDIKVNYNQQYVEKDNEKMYFYGDTLMFAAIFSDKSVYECQLGRLIQRAEQLALLYKDKSNFVSKTGCSSNLDLIGLSNSMSNYQNSLNLGTIVFFVEDISTKNKLAECKLW